MVVGEAACSEAALVKTRYATHRVCNFRASLDKIH